MLCSWEGNRRSGVTATMRHKLRVVSTYSLSGLREADVHPVLHTLYNFGSSSHLLYYKHTYVYSPVINDVVDD